MDLDEKRRGFLSKERLEELLPVGSNQILKTLDYEGKYGRIIGTFGIDDTDVSEILLIEGLAEIYE